MISLLKKIFLITCSIQLINASMQKQEMPLDCTGLLPEIQKIIVDYLDSWEEYKEYRSSPDALYEYTEIFLKPKVNLKHYILKSKYLKTINNILEQYRIDSKINNINIWYSYVEFLNLFQGWYYREDSSAHFLKLELLVSPNNRYLYIRFTNTKNAFIIDLEKSDKQINIMNLEKNSYDSKEVIFTFKNVSSFNFSRDSKYISVKTGDCAKIFNISDKKETYLSDIKNHILTYTNFTNDNIYFNLATQEKFKIFKNQYNELIQPLKNGKQQLENPQSMDDEFKKIEKRVPNFKLRKKLINYLDSFEMLLPTLALVAIVIGLYIKQ